LQGRSPEQRHAVGDAQIRLRVQHLHALVLVVAAQKKSSIGGDQPAAAPLGLGSNKGIEQLAFRAGALAASRADRRRR
jgi:hypothetical protein